MFRFRKREVLPEPPAGHGDFWAVVHVKLAEPVYDVDNPAETPAQGYYRNFGVRAAPDRVPDILRDAVDDGRIVWDDTEWDLVDPARQSAGAVTGAGPPLVERRARPGSSSSSLSAMGDRRHDVCRSASRAASAAQSQEDHR